MDTMRKFLLLVAGLVMTMGMQAQDKKIPVSSATASSVQSGDDNAVSNAYDGSMSTIWHSTWSNTQFPVTFVLKFKEPAEVDYVRYTPRQDGNVNGNWREVEVAYSSSTSGSSFTKVGTYDLQGSGAAYDFYLNGSEGVTCGQVKFTIRSGQNNFASAAEIEAYAIDRSKQEAFARYFEDELFTVVKEGMKDSLDVADADVKRLAESLMADAEGYKKFRVGEYEAYMTLGTLQARLGTKTQYSKYENPTGVYVKAGESFYVMACGIGDDPVKLKVKNWVENEDASSYPLRKGLNYITASTEGNVFVDYYTDNFESAAKVKLHFINAPVQGYWDQQTMTNEDWKALMKGRSSSDNTVLMVQSEHAQLAYPVSAWLTHCPSDVNTLMNLYEDVQWAQRDILGLKKFDKETKNRQLFYATNYGFMAAGGEGAYCHVNSLGAIMKPDAANFDFWGVGHEWGHNNQISPGFHWSGCGETTNNIYASWGQIHAQIKYKGAPYGLRLEDEVTGVGEYSGMRGGRMQTYFEEGLRKGVAWQLQDGPDYHNATPNTITVTGQDASGKSTGQVTTTSRNYDHFVKLAPFWQLNLWGTLAGKCPDIIPNVIEKIRTTANYSTTYNTNGKQQVNWMKLACDEAQLNLLPFFEKAGMLRPINAYIEDYGAGWNIIDEAMINNLKAYVEGKNYPDFTEEINYINGYNYKTYRDSLKLEVPATMGQGCTLSGTKVTVKHSVVKNAVAFETYNSMDELIRITMYALGSDAAHAYTQVLFPSSLDIEEDAAYIMAVGYDGERKKIYQKYDEEMNAARVELATMIGSINSLLDMCSSINYAKLQTTKKSADYYLFTNADQNVVGNKDDGQGIDALVDGSVDTYMHTQWGGTAVADDHYLQVNLGEGKELSEFAFTYATRKASDANNTSPAPTKIEVYGSTDGTAFTDKIATFTAKDKTNALPSYTALGQEWTSTTIKADKAYGYLRFVVKESNGPGGKQYGGHYFFAMSEFGLITANTINYNVTQDQLGATRQALTSAESAFKSAKTASEVMAAIEALQTQCNKLKAEMKYVLGVDYGYASLYLPFAARIPEGATAYIVDSLDAKNAMVNLQALEGEVLPAYTPVIVKAAKAEYAFAYTSDEATDDVEGNLLKGSEETIYKKSETGYSYYTLDQQEGKVALYSAAMNYSDENGKEVSANRGKYFKVEANTVYLEWKRSGSAKVATFNFEQEGMGIDMMESAGDKATVIYNICGQRLDKITSSDIYIVNGKKQYVIVR